MALIFRFGAVFHFTREHHCEKLPLIPHMDTITKKMSIHQNYFRNVDTTQYFIVALSYLNDFSQSWTQVSPLEKGE